MPGHPSESLFLGTKDDDEVIYFRGKKASLQLENEAKANGKALNPFPSSYVRENGSIIRE